MDTFFMEEMKFYLLAKMGLLFGVFLLVFCLGRRNNGTGLFVGWACDRDR
jgi:hypothetical protein